MPFLSCVPLIILSGVVMKTFQALVREYIFFFFFFFYIFKDFSSGSVWELNLLSVMRLIALFCNVMSL